MLEYAEVGSQFLFGPLGAKSGPFGVIFAFQVLPIVIFIASFFSIFYYLGVMQVLSRDGDRDAEESWAPAAPNRSTLRPVSSWARPKRR